MKQDFNKEKISVIQKISGDVVSSLTLDIGTVDNDILLNQMTVKLSGYIYSNMADERELVYYCPRPRFFDWLFRRRKTAVFNLKVKDLKLNPPKSEDTKRIYTIETKS